MVDFAPVGRHALARKTFLNKLSQVAKVFPVVVFDRTANYQEAATMRATGIKWFPTIRAEGVRRDARSPAGREGGRSEGRAAAAATEPETTSATAV